ncbi:MAG: ABC transporter substrate-binding protein, partial [Promethearchaeota archaeon]
LDPVDTWDIPSAPLQHECAEGLVEYDLTTHPGYELRPTLSEYWIWENDKRVSFKIRENVYFHDGTLLDADAVKWNFERLVYFSNASGTLPTNTTAGFSRSLYLISNGSSLFHSFESDGAYNFTINLNQVFSSFIPLITFTANYILSPASTPRYRYLNLADDKIVGTGPFKWVHFILDSEVRMERNDRYWATGAFFEEAVFRIIEDTTARTTAALAGQFDIIAAGGMGGVLTETVAQFDADPDFHVEVVGESLGQCYIELYAGPGDPDLMNPWWFQTLNVTWRKAMSVSINYTYIYEEIGAGLWTKGVPGVPRAMPSHNASVVTAAEWVDTNGWEAGVEWARQMMQSMGFGTTWDASYPGNNEADWTGATFRSMDLNRHFGSTTSQRLNQLMMDNWGLIGIEVTETIRNWGEYLLMSENTPWTTAGGYICWSPDYIAPFNMIDPLWNWRSASTFTRLNDTHVDQQLMLAGVTTNDQDRWDILSHLQSYIYDIRFNNNATAAHIPGFVAITRWIYMPDMLDPPHNVIAELGLKWWRRA